MFLTIPTGAELLYLLGGAAGATGLGRLAMRRALRRQAQKLTGQLRSERAAGHHLCFSTLQSLAYAIEASDPYNAGHLDCVQRGVNALAHALNLAPAANDALRAAALLHNVGRLGVPDHILHKSEALAPEEREKLHAHPALGARILASIPFPWPVVPLVRHHAEHWDGRGYPDGLKGSAIPLGARILSVASAYSAWTRPRPYRPALTPGEALAEIEARSGTQFDPAVVVAFRTIAAQLREEAAQMPDAGLLAAVPSDADAQARSALRDIAASQRETLGLTTLAQAVAGSLHLEELGETLLRCTRDIVPSAACALFLPDDEGEFLCGHFAQGVNARHLLGSHARIGAYLTGRAYTRGEITRASFLADDLSLRDVSDPWVPFRSTLIVPLTENGQAIGTLNLYAEEPDAFGPDAQRVLRLVATQASRALGNARRFHQAQETAYTDALTGLRNGRYLREFSEREINRAKRDETPLAVLNIDLDNFKPINDQFGHARGDQTLREVAEILQAHVRNYDLAARSAGDEFVVVLSRTGRRSAEAVAAKLQVAIERHGQKLSSRESGFPALGASIGIALFPEDAPDMSGLLCHSDAAMYENKQSRRDSRAGGNADRAAALR